MAAKSLRTKLVELANRHPLLEPAWRRYRSARLAERSPFDNVYHCCTQKTASQWFRGVFADPLFSDYTGLVSVPFIELGLRGTSIKQAFQRGTIATHLYIDYPTYQAIPKPPTHRTFFVMRDPRDAVVSWYFWARYSRAPVPQARALGHELAARTFEDGMIYLIDRLHEYGSFTTQLSWLGASADPHVRLFRYEDLAADNRTFLRLLLAYLEVHLPEAKFEALYRRNNFQTLSGARAQGTEDVGAHNRKGIAGDWRNHFTGRIVEHFIEVAGDAPARLGYPEA